MGMNRSYKNNKTAKKKYEEEFFNSYVEEYNKIPEIDIQKQKQSMKNAIEHIKRARDYGIDRDFLKDMLLFNNSNLIDLISEPNLAHFYQYRTYEALSTMKLEPFVKEIIESGVDVREVSSKPENFTPNVKNNLQIFVCGMIADLECSDRAINNPELHDLVEKSKSHSLTMDDYEPLCKFLNEYMSQMRIGKGAVWNKLKKNPEECRKFLYKNRDLLFEIKDISLSNSVNMDNDENDMMSNRVVNDSLLNAIRKSSKECGCQQVKHKKYTKPFISNNKEESFLVLVNEMLYGISDNLLQDFYKVLMMSETAKDPKIKAASKNLVYEFFSKVNMRGTIFSAKKRLLGRIAALVNYLYSSECMDESCEINNERLSKLGLGELQISSEEVVNKFLKDGTSACIYYFDEDMDLDKMANGTVLSNAPAEIIIGLAAFYTNRMAKQVKRFRNLSYIFNKEDVIDKIYENPDFRYEDIGLPDDVLCRYMALYNVLRDKISRRYASMAGSNPNLSEDDLRDDIHYTFDKYRNVCSSIEPTYKGRFHEDIDIIMVDAVTARSMYKLKEFAVKSLMYAAITDKSKNIMNWGFVKEKEKIDNFLLVGFDIKGLNMPIFMHMTSESLVDFVEELTGDAEIPVYEGADDMFSYLINRRITAQVMYPVSKSERKMMDKMAKSGVDNRFFKHINWMTQTNAPLPFKNEPGSRLYNLKKGIVRRNDKIIQKNKNRNVDIDEKEC